jgi:hypothetical protein
LPGLTDRPVLDKISLGLDNVGLWRKWPHILTSARVSFTNHYTEREKRAMVTGKSFGALVRREREAKGIGLREMAKMIRVSPTYLSKVERDEFAPPAEDKVKAIANIIGCDSDDLLALAGRVASDLSGIIKQQPRGMATFLRAAKGLTAEELEKLAIAARKAKEK